MGTMATPARHLRIPDDVWLPAQDLAWRRRTSVTAMVTGFLRSEVEAGASEVPVLPVKIVADERVPPGTAALIGPDHDGKPQAQVMTNLAAKPERKPRAAPRPRCPHPGLPRSAGGWCKGCQVTLEPGGYLPAGTAGEGNSG